MSQEVATRLSRIRHHPRVNVLFELQDSCLLTKEMSKNVLTELDSSGLRLPDDDYLPLAMSYEAFRKKHAYQSAQILTAKRYGTPGSLGHEFLIVHARTPDIDFFLGIDRFRLNDGRGIMTIISASNATAHDAARNIPAH